MKTCDELCFNQISQFSWVFRRSVKTCVMHLELSLKLFSRKSIACFSTLINLEPPLFLVNFFGYKERCRPIQGFPPWENLGIWLTEKNCEMPHYLVTMNQTTHFFHVLYNSGEQFDFQFWFWKCPSMWMDIFQLLVLLYYCQLIFWITVYLTIMFLTWSVL